MVYLTRDRRLSLVFGANCSLIVHSGQSPTWPRARRRQRTALRAVAEGFGLDADCAQLPSLHMARDLRIYPDV